MDKISKKKLWIGGGALLLLLIIAYYAFKPGVAGFEFGVAEKLLFERAIREEGVTRIREKFTILAPVSGVMQRVTMHAGDKVQSGQAMVGIQWDAPRPVRSPINGVVLKILREDAGPIEMGSPILEVGDPRSMEIVVDILTQDSVQVRPGMNVSITEWGGSTALNARVRTVEPQAVTRVSALGVQEQRVRVLADLVTPPEERAGLGDNFRVECAIVVETIQNALAVPVSSLFRENNSWFVYRVVKGRLKKTNVEIQTRNERHAVVTKGLNEGESLLLYPSESARDGLKVKEEK